MVLITRYRSLRSLPRSKRLRVRYPEHCIELYLGCSFSGYRVNLLSLELRLAQKKQKQSSASNRPITDFFGKTVSIPSDYLQILATSFIYCDLICPCHLQSSKERDCAEPGEEEITVASQSESSMVYMPISKLSTLNSQLSQDFHLQVLQPHYSPYS